MPPFSLSPTGLAARRFGAESEKTLKLEVGLTLLGWYVSIALVLRLRALDLSPSAGRDDGRDLVLGLDGSDGSSAYTAIFRVDADDAGRGLSSSYTESFRESGGGLETEEEDDVGAGWSGVSARRDPDPVGDCPREDDDDGACAGSCPRIDARGGVSA